ncbi:hypothetical protein ACJX0J_032039, partial [Zea mays]
EMLVAPYLCYLLNIFTFLHLVNFLQHNSPLLSWVNICYMVFKIKGVFDLFGS